jgi:hypothetical protein
MSISQAECRSKCEVGFTDAYRHKFEGTGINSELYRRGYSRMKGDCVGCENNGENACKLPKDKHCEK